MGRTTFGVTLAAVLLCADAGSAQQAPAPAADVTALAKQTQNPVGDLISIPLQFNFNTAGDLRDTTLFNLNVQPVFPFKLTLDWNVITRAIVPIDSIPGENGASESGVGDIQLQFFMTPAKPGPSSRVRPRRHRPCALGLSPLELVQSVSR